MKLINNRIFYVTQSKLNYLQGQGVTTKQAKSTKIKYIHKSKVKCAIDNPLVH